ncbi:hypothetical protein [Dactylosporangium sp. NPDC051541]|uniref:hypothetical protein n=1 Tax=Dactylosporangium sp. NPDC051541 TaxID=3363977 RepID=UPI00379516E2
MTYIRVHTVAMSLQEAAMPSELAVAIAAAIAGRGGATVAGEGDTALAALARTIRDQLQRGRREGEAPEADARNEAAAQTADSQATARAGNSQATAQSGGHNRQNALAEQLSRALADDPRFAGLVRDQWHAVQTELTMGEAAVHNSFSGTADKVVQARDIHGDLTF